MDKINVFEFAKAFNAFKQVKEGFKDVHEEKINAMCELLPSGSGIDAGTKFNWDKSKPEKLIFNFGFHHLNENGHYTEWTDHRVEITPSLVGKYDLKITGRDLNGVKEYLYQVFDEVFEG